MSLGVLYFVWQHWPWRESRTQVGTSWVKTQEGPGLGWQSPSPEPTCLQPSNIPAPLRSQSSGRRDNDKQDYVPRMTARIYKHPFRKALGLGSYSLRKEPWEEHTMTVFTSPAASPGAGRGLEFNTQESLHNESSVETHWAPPGGSG